MTWVSAARDRAHAAGIGIALAVLFALVFLGSFIPVIGGAATGA